MNVAKSTRLHGFPLAAEQITPALMELDEIPVSYDFALSQARLPSFQVMATAWRAFRAGVTAFIDAHDGDLRRMTASLHLPLTLLPLWESLPQHDWALIARPDMILSSGRPVIIDVNASSLAGHFPLNDMTLRSHRHPSLCQLFSGPGKPRFIMGHYADILRRFLTHEDDLIALAYFADEGSGSQNPSLWHYRAQASELRRLGLTAQLAHVEDLEVRRGSVYIGGRRVGLIQRFFAPQPDNDRHMSELARLARAAREAGVTVVTGLGSEIVNTKATIAFLSDEQFTDGLKPSLATALSKAVPWTRILAERFTFWRGQRIDLPDWVVANRTRLVLKPSLGYMGLQVLIGREVDHAEWATAVQAALSCADPFVVQELVVPDRQQVNFISKNGSIHTECGPAVYGAYVLDGEFVGAICRHGRRGYGHLMINGLTGAVPSPVYWTGS